MGLETGSYISALVSTNPVGATDPKSQGDDHIRFIKAKLLETFPNITGAVTASHTELNLVAGATGGLATLSVSFAALVTLVSQMGSFSASVTSSDITGSIRAPVLQTQAGFTAGTFTAATVVVNSKGVVTAITANSGLSAASQAQMEAASSNAVAVTPGTAHFHPGVAKFYVSVTDNAGTPTVVSSYNVTSITDNGAGDFTINLTTGFSAINMAITGMAKQTSGSSEVNLVHIKDAANNPGTSAIRVLTSRYNVSALDVPWWSVIGFGDI